MKRILSLVLAVSALLCISCKQQKTEEVKTNVYPTITVSKADEVINTTYAASIEGQQLVEIRPQVSGIITSIKINEGDNVRKGQLLFVIDQVPYRAALDVAKANVSSAEAQLATAKLTAESNQMLFDEQIISQYELQTALNALSSAESAYAQAKAQLTTASNNLSYTEVRSPVNGSAGMIPYKVGALVSSSISAPLVTVSDDNYINAYFSMNERMMLDLIQEYGSQEKFLEQMPDIHLTLLNGTEYPHTGRIDAVSGLVDSSTGAIRLRARFANDEHLLRSGGNATVVIPTVMKNCIVIPQTATYEIQEKVFAFKVQDGKAQSREIEVFKYNNGKNYIVLSGLDEGDVIISEGAGLIKDGTSVSVSNKEE